MRAGQAKAVKKAMEDGKAAGLENAAVTADTCVEREVRKRLAKAAKEAAPAAENLEAQRLAGLELADEAVRCCAEKEAEVRSLRTSLGMASAQVQDFRLAETKRAENLSNATTARIRSAAQAKETLNNRTSLSELLEKVRSLEAEVLRRGAPPPPPTDHADRRANLIQQRTAPSSTAPFTPRAYEYMRRIVEEGNISVEGAHTEIALILSMFIEGGPTDGMMVCANTVKHAFEKLGVMDNDAEKLANELSNEFWAMGCDGGNKGRAIEMMAYCIWDAVRKRPVCRPLAAGDLHGDQTAKNSEATMMRAFERLGLKAQTAVSNTSDGADAATQASENFLESLSQLSGLLHRLSSNENCCMHGEVLAENAGARINAPRLGSRPHPGSHPAPRASRHVPAPHICDRLVLFILSYLLS